VPDDADLTLILEQWASGDQNALDRLAPLVYPRLHQLASSALSRGLRADTLQTTAVVNELFLRLLARRPPRLESRAHFYALAAKIIRMALVDHYRTSQADKRGGARDRVPLHDELSWVNANSLELIAFDRAMSELEAMDRQQAEIVGMRYLLGCTAEETAELTGLSKATVDRKARLARAWLFRCLRGHAEPPPVGFPNS
jgi:RNA polymerase sigma factor (TIGR02999 family)